MRLGQGAVRLGVTTLVGGLAVLAGPATDAAFAGASSAASACGSLGTGVTVVIDNGSSISTRCAGGDPSSAMAALSAVASVVTPQRYPGSVVCRIDGYPASDPCIQMPPASAYWSFYTAKRGGSWSYSSTGAAGYNPAPGTVVGFAFGAGARPRIGPPAAPAAPVAPAKPRVTTTPKPATSKGAGSTGSNSSGSSAGGSTSAGPSATSTPSASVVTSPTGSATTGTVTDAATSTMSAASAAAPIRATDGSGTARLAAAGGVLAALGLGALLLARRRST